MGYGDRLREIREQQGLQQEELARQVGITQTAICKVETGKRQLSFEEAIRIAEVLHVSLPELAGIPTDDEHQSQQAQQAKRLIVQCTKKGREFTALLEELEQAFVHA